MDRYTIVQRNFFFFKWIDIERTIYLCPRVFRSVNHMYIEENRYKNFVKLQRKPMMSFGVGLSMNCNCCFRMPPSSYLLSHVSSVSPFSYSCCWSSFNSNNLNLTRRASSEGYLITYIFHFHSHHS